MGIAQKVNAKLMSIIASLLAKTEKLLSTQNFHDTGIMDVKYEMWMRKKCQLEKL